MSDTRPYPKILRTTVEADRALREYAARAHLAPFEALILAIGLLRTKDEREAASERAYKFASLWHNLARKLWHRWRSGLWAIAREQNAADGLRREVASAREATRRADAEVERLTRELAASTEAARVANVDRARAEQATADERATSIKLDLDWQEASGAASPEELTTALETHRARRAEAAPCACALPDDFEAKITERAPGWKGTAAELRARVIALGFSRYDALATDAAKRAAAKGA